MRTIPLYLLALIVAIANTPTDIYQICAWNHGTVNTEPWKRTAKAAPVRERVKAFLDVCRTWCQSLGGLDPLGEAGIATVDALTLGAAGALHGSRLKVLRQAHADIKGELDAVNTKIAAIGETVTREKRAMNDGERTQFDALKAEKVGLKTRLDDNDEMLAVAEELNAADRRPGLAVPDADAQATLRAASLIVGRDLTAEGEQRRQGFFGRALQGVRAIAIKQATDEDIKAVKMMAGPTGMNTDVPSEGGFMVAPERSSSIIQRMYDTGAIASRVFRMPVGANSNGMILPAIDETSRADSSRYGGIVSGWLGQGNSLTAGKPKFRLMDLKLRKVGAFVYSTDELLADSVALEAWINKYLPLELTFRTEDAIVNGDGSNKPAGMLSSGATVSVARTTALRVLYEDVSAMWARMWNPLRANAIWQIDQSVEQQLEQMSIAIGTGGVLAPIYKPATSVFRPDGTQGYLPATLYGRPILTTEYNANLGTVGDIILWAPDEYVVIDKGGVEQAVSLHVAFLTDEAVYRFMYRVDGQMSWSAPLTPKSAGSTLAPIVTLAT